jgi:hypothetical protein
LQSLGGIACYRPFCRSLALSLARHSTLEGDRHTDPSVKAASYFNRSKGAREIQTREELNKALVLEAFDTLFNKRDYAAAKRYWSPRYIQHGAHIAPRRSGLFNLVKTTP